MQVEANRGPIEELDVQALAVAVFKGEKPGEGFLKKLDDLSGGLVRSAIDADEFAGKEGEIDDEEVGANQSSGGKVPAPCHAHHAVEQCSSHQGGG